MTQELGFGLRPRIALYCHLTATKRQKHECLLVAPAPKKGRHSALTPPSVLTPPVASPAVTASVEELAVGATASDSPEVEEVAVAACNGRSQDRRRSSGAVPSFLGRRRY